VPRVVERAGALLPSLIILWLFGGSLSSISVGTQAFTGRRFAEKRFDDAGAVLANAAFFAVLAGVVFSVLGYLSIPAILGVFIKTDAAREAARAYLGWRLLGITSMAATFAFKAFFDGIGKTHVHLVSAVVMNALNIILCLIFIFGNATLGAPRWASPAQASRASSPPTSACSSWSATRSSPSTAPSSTPSASRSSTRASPGHCSGSRSRAPSPPSP
jgi:MATE family multidrug resistance protein